MELSPSWEVTSRLATENILNTGWNSKVYYLLQEPSSGQDPEQKESSSCQSILFLRDAL
jgi:hypothetical protein